MPRRLDRRAARVLLAGALLAAGAATAQDKPNRAQALAAWQHVARVLQHPRCLNCHQANIPLQGDSKRLHIPLVERGPANLGVGAMTCGNCHNASGNNDTARVPGAPHWSLAPLSMKWQGLNSAQLCRQLKDLKRNGGRSADALVEHMGGDALVLWGWNPGVGLEPVAVPHAEFIQHLKTWNAGGQACPA